MYRVEYWRGHPCQDEDADCWGSDSFYEMAEAYSTYLAKVRPYYAADSDYVAMSSVEEDGEILIFFVRKNPDYNPKASDEADENWRREIAMEAGMGLGCDAYNNAMGY